MIRDIKPTSLEFDLGSYRRELAFCQLSDQKPFMVHAQSGDLNITARSTGGILYPVRAQLTQTGWVNVEFEVFCSELPEEVPGWLRIDNDKFPEFMRPDDVRAILTAMSDLAEFHGRANTMMKLHYGDRLLESQSGMKTREASIDEHFRGGSSPLRDWRYNTTLRRWVDCGPFNESDLPKDSAVGEVLTRRQLGDLDVHIEQEVTSEIKQTDKRYGAWA